MRNRGGIGGAISRRDLLRYGSLSLLGGTPLPALLRAAEPVSGIQHVKRTRSVILLYLFGGPSHIDMFDMKPNAPAEIRGEFRPIASALPGLFVCEHLPRLARWMTRATLLRSVTHSFDSHNPYAILTGFSGGTDEENLAKSFASRSDHPGIGSICQYLGMGPSDLPCHVYLPSHPGYSQGLHRAGPYGGCLGRRYDPMIPICEPRFDREFDPKCEMFNPIAPYGSPSLPSLEANPDMSSGRLLSRQALLERMDRSANGIEVQNNAESMGHYQRKALEMLTTGRVRQAFDLTKEPENVKERYGPTLFGTSTLIARRLAEVGVTFITVTTESRGGGHWDSHENNFGMLRTFNLPNLDQISSALLEDLDRRDLLSSTTVAIMGEMGREPRINKDAGRDHWPQCGFALLIGGGIKEGFVLGASDRLGAYPVDHPVSPGDLAATIYHLLGVDAELTFKDLTGRPIPIAHGGNPIHNIIV